MQTWRRVFTDPRLLLVTFMGFSSGLPLLLIGGTMKAWLMSRNLDLATIGFFGWVGLPYSWKFVWAPLLDRYVLPMGRRRGWLFVSQIVLMFLLAAMSRLDPQSQMAPLALCGVLIAFFSASQDIVVDAYRREILPDSELGLGSSLAVFGYRMAMLLAGSGAFLLADRVDWPAVYLVLAAFMSVGLVTTLLAPEPDVHSVPPRSLRESVVGPMREFFTRDSAWLILSFIVLYKVGESISAEMLNPFYLSLGFNNTEIGAMAKGVGLFAALGGGLLGGVLIVRLGIYRSLWVFGILQSFGILLFSVLAQAGHDRFWLGFSIGAESLTSGMATTAYVAFMASQTNKKFTATQYALLSSLMSVPRTVLGGFAGLQAAHLGWTWHFIVCALYTIPGLLLLIPLKRFVTETAEDE